MYKIMYIDDQIEINLDSQLKKIFLEDYYSFEYDNENMNYDTLLKEINNFKPNVILIDQILFSNSNVNQPYTGEEFLLILRKFNPFLETFIISQNDLLSDRFIRKYNPLDHYESVDEYYGSKVQPFIARAFESLDSTKKIYAKLEKSTTFNKITIEKIKNLMDGVSDYDDIKKEDIDNLVDIFKKIEEKFYE